MRNDVKRSKRKSETSSTVMKDYFVIQTQRGPEEAV